jgi:hypothetical protein
MIWPDGLRRGHLHVLDIETGREYPFLVKGGTDSELNGREIRAARKSKSLYPMSGACMNSWTIEDDKFAALIRRRLLMTSQSDLSIKEPLSFWPSGIQ